MLKNLKIKYKILLLPSLAVTAFLVLLSANQILNNRNDRLLGQIESGYYPSLELSWNLELALNTIHRFMQEAITTSNETALQETEPLNRYFIEQVNEAHQNSIISENDSYILKTKFAEYYSISLSTARQLIRGGKSEYVTEAQKTVNSKFTELKTQMQRAKQNDREEITAALASARKNFQKSQRLIKSIIVFCIIILGGLSLILARSFTRPLKEIVDVSNKFANGDDDVSVEFKSEDEIGVLGNAFNSMIEKIKRSKRKIEKENWLKTGISELNDRMRGDLDLVSLSQNIIQFIAPYLRAQVGAIYLANDEDKLKMAGSYAFATRKTITNEFNFGEGIVGQCALEKSAILITDVPDNYVVIQSGLGQGAPRHLIVVPFLYDQKVAGVIELASFSEFTEIQRSFLKQAAENIAISLNSTRSRVQITELLKKTQSQQESLQQKNQELENQAAALKDSKQKLEMQREELRQTNEELEIQTKALEKQRDEIKQKNIDLEQARREIEIKAKDLELTSKYKSEFLANMSHELRTPLNSLLILSNLLSENKGDNLTEQQVQFAKTIHSSGTDLLNLINDILDLSKVEAGKLDISIDEVNISDLADNLQRCFLHLAKEKSIEFSIELEEGIPAFIKTDRQRIEQILKNLLSNAFKFTPAGQVTLRVARPNHNKILAMSQLDSRNSVAFSVIDTGIGLAPEHQKVIFEAFQQIDSSSNKKFQGTGLGLSISRELSKLLGGEIQVQSQKGEGSTFTLFVPIDYFSLKKPRQEPTDSPKTENRRLEYKTGVSHTMEVETEPAQKRPAADENNVLNDDREHIASSDRTILIIEDDIKFSDILLGLTREKNFKGLCAIDGESGIELAHRYTPNAIILDIGLPGIDGWTVMEKLKSHPDTRHIPVHFISASENSIQARKMGAIGFLSKPVNMEQLDEAFNKIEAIISKKVKKLLVVEKDQNQRDAILDLIGNGDVKTLNVSSGESAIDLLKTNDFDCMILDLVLDDMSGFELLEKIRTETGISNVPVIIYTGNELSGSEQERLRKYAESVVIKGVKSQERLLDETSLFLHRIEANLPEEKKNMIRRVHDRTSVLNGKKILIVDDDMRNVFALSSVLEQHNMKIIIGRNGREALERLQSNVDIDLILMDIMMPEMDGYEAMVRIREQRQFDSIPIIALTAKAMKSDRKKCIEAGANDYMTKPVEADKLLSLLQVWLYQ